MYIVYSQNYIYNGKNHVITNAKQSLGEWPNDFYITIQHIIYNTNKQVGRGR